MRKIDRALRGALLTLAAPALAGLALSVAPAAAQMIAAPDRSPGGPMDIVIEGNRIARVSSVGVPRKAPEAECAYKLWMAHGITTGRGVVFGPHDWSISEKARSAANEIVAPRMWVYPFTGAGGEGWDDRLIMTPEDARAWARYVKESGGDGLKLKSYRPELMEALLDEAARLGLGSTAGGGGA